MVQGRDTERVTPGGPRRRPSSSRYRFVIRRLVWVVPVVVGVLVVTFALMHAAPGSPWDHATAQEGRATFSPAALHSLDAKYGLDQPLWRQLVRYLGNAARLDFGDSYQYPGQHVRDLIVARLPHTLVLGTLAFLVVVVGGTGLGMLAAMRRDSKVDRLVTGLITLGGSVPNFVTGILLVLLFSVGLRRATGGRVWLPDGGYGLDAHLVLPLVTLSLLPLSFVARLTRASTLDALGRDHVRTARAKGLRPRRVTVRHVLDNALLPIVTALGPLFAFLVTGSVVVERLFQIDGLGGSFVTAVADRDYPMILGTTAVFAALFALANLVVDVVYALVDPRVDVR